MGKPAATLSSRRPVQAPGCGARLSRSTCFAFGWARCGGHARPTKAPDSKRSAAQPRTLRLPAGFGPGPRGRLHAWHACKAMALLDEPPRSMVGWHGGLSFQRAGRTIHRLADAFDAPPATVRDVHLPGQGIRRGHASWSAGLQPEQRTTVVGSGRSSCRPCRGAPAPRLSAQAGWLRHSGTARPTGRGHLRCSLQAWTGWAGARAGCSRCWWVAGGMG